MHEAVDSSTRMYRPWFTQFANRFVTIARKAQAQDLTKIEQVPRTGLAMVFVCRFDSLSVSEQEYGATAEVPMRKMMT